MDISDNKLESEVKFKTRYHQRYFNIILLDILSKPDPAIGRNEGYLDHLRSVCDSPSLGNTESISSLTSAVKLFHNWLDGYVDYGNDPCEAKFWFPSIERAINLKVKRVEYIKICGNISKHNFSRLTHQCRIIVDIFKQNDVDIPIKDAMRTIDEFYNWYHDHLLSYHSTLIAVQLNDIRWGIYEYLLPEFSKSIICEKDLKYRYRYPDELFEEYVKSLYWDLMNDIRGRPYAPRFCAPRHLKERC